MTQAEIRWAVGLMSGTSADGIDAVLARVSGRGHDMRASVAALRSFPFEPSLRAEIRRCCDPATGTVDRLCRLNFALGERFAEAAVEVMRAGAVEPDQVTVVGSHGQTVHHIPPGDGPGSTLQIGEPSLIAERTGVTTVADFRPRDMAVGGQGAPLVPFADFVLFRSDDATRVLQNIGGIANLTYLPAGGSIDEVIAFDTGPGNGLVDAAVRRFFDGGPDGCGFDRDGRIAATGKVMGDRLARWRGDAYFARRPPKSTGLEEFGSRRLERWLAEDPELLKRGADVVATLTELTAETIADAYAELLPDCPKLDEVIVCGGGARNPVLMDALARRASARVRTIDEFGIVTEAKEALSFALLALATLDGVPSNVRGATGARRGAVLGKIIPGRRWG